jgi:transposase
MFQDEARFGRINDVRRCWAPRPMRPLCQAMLTHEYTYAYAAVDVQTGELDSLILPHVNTHCMQLFLDEVGQRHPNEHIVMVLDGAGWHTGGELAPPANMRLLSLPPYAPELNPVEQIWNYLKNREIPNLCACSIAEVGDLARRRLKSMQRRPSLVRSFWKQTELAL